MNKEKLLFVCTCLLSTLILGYYYLEVFTVVPTQQATAKKDHALVTIDLHREIFPNALDNYLKDGSRKIFSATSDKKKLPPVALRIPPAQLSDQIIIPPLPAPDSQYWIKFFLMSKLEPSASTEPLSVSIDLETLAHYTTRDKNILSDFAKRLQKQVRNEDSVQLKNGQVQRGKILSSAKEVVLHVSHPTTRTYRWPLHLVKNVERAISLQKLCIREYEKIGPGEASKLLQLANACAELELPELAEKFFQRLLEKSPNFIDGYLAYAQYQVRLLDYERAYRICLMAQAQNLGNEKLALQIAAIQASLGFTNKAIRELARYQSPRALLMRIELAFTLNNWDMLQSLLETNAHRSLQDDERKTFQYWRAYFAFHRGQLEQCLELCKRVPDDTRFCLLQGASLYLQGRLEQAAQMFVKATEHDIRAWYNLALVYFARGSHARSLQILEALANHIEFAHDPSSVLATLGYFQYLKEPEKNYQQSEKLLEQALQSNPQNALCYYLSGKIEEQRGNSGWDQAYQYYQQALALDFSCNYIMLKAGLLALRQNNLPDTLGYLQEVETVAFLLPEQYSRIQAILAELHAISDKIPTAKRYISKALQADSQNIFALQVDAWIANHQGNYDKADASLQRILSTDPQNAYAQYALQKIQENKSRVLWEDYFARAQNNLLRRQWLEIEPPGISIGIHNEQALFAGRQLEANVPAKMGRLLATDKFISIAGLLDASQAAYSYLGIFVAAVPRGPILYWGKNEQQQLVYAVTNSSKKMNWQVVPQKLQKWPQGQTRLWIRKVENNHYQLGLNDTAASKAFVNLHKFPRIQVGFFGYATNKVYWAFTVDNVKIIETQ